LGYNIPGFIKTTEEDQTVSQVSTILAELLRIFPRYEFEKLESQHKGNRYTKYFSGWQQLIVLLYAQISGKDSLRELETGLRVQSDRWYHVGLKGIKRSTLSDAMKGRSSEIFEGLFYKLLDKCKGVTPKHKFRFKNPLYTLDSTLIDLCLSVFPWAVYRKRKGAIKLHYLYDHSGALPTFMVMTDGKHHDIRVAKAEVGFDLALLPDSIISIDKAYIDYKWLSGLNKRGVYFVVRAKDNIDCRLTGQHQPIRSKNVVRDDLIALGGFYSARKYPEALRLVGYIDPETRKYYEYLTNNFQLSAQTIADIYKSRWQIELFFKWIKQNLKIKSFLGTTPNAVKTQIWVAMCYYLLLTYIKYQARYAHSITELSRMIKEVVMIKANLIDILSLNAYTIKRIRDPIPQMDLF
jgi:hypothetical protein